MFSWHIVSLSFLLLPSVLSAPQDWHSNSHCTSTQTKTLTITSPHITKTTHVTSIYTSTAPAKTTIFSVTTNSTTTNVQTSTNVTTTTTTLTTVSTSTVQPPPSYTPVDVSIPGAQSERNGTVTKRGTANVVEERETWEKAHYNQASGPFTSLGNSGQARGPASTTWSQWQGKPSCLTTTTTITKTVPAAPITKTLTVTSVTVTTPGKLLSDRDCPRSMLTIFSSGLIHGHGTQHNHRHFDQCQHQHSDLDLNILQRYHYDLSCLCKSASLAHLARHTANYFIQGCN